MVWTAMVRARPRALKEIVDTLPPGVTDGPTKCSAEAGIISCSEWVLRNFTEAFHLKICFMKILQLTSLFFHLWIDKQTNMSTTSAFELQDW